MHSLPETGTRESGDVEVARFFQIVPGGRLPCRADRGVGDTLPARARRYCEPVSAASAFGWSIFVACRFQLVWDGSEIFWRTQDMDRFLPLRCVHYPGFPEVFDRAVPEGIRGFAPPFLAASPQTGVVKIWPGSMVRTAPGWSLLVRPVPNLARPSGYELYEGILETDGLWFGPLFTNVRLTRTNVPIEFDDDVPFMQVQPLRKDQYDDSVLDSYSATADLTRLTHEDWEHYVQTVVEPNRAPERRRGRYKSLVQKARAERLAAVGG
ncbi:MAG: DUF6065 family protein [Hyphomicrobiaceae bacterium]